MRLTHLQESDWREMMLWLLRQRKRYRVTEASMWPTLEPGDEVLVNPRAYRFAQPFPGDIVVAHHPKRQSMKVIKRVGDVGEDGVVFLQGDNRSESTDSRHFGSVRTEQILGRVTSKFA